MLIAFYIFIGGGLGSLARFGMGKWLGETEGKFPLGTFGANFTACLILGVVAGFALKNANFSEGAKAFLVVGFCGGFSTFSTFTNEIFLLVDDGKGLTAALYIGISLLVCVGGLIAGYSLAKLF